MTIQLATQFKLRQRVADLSQPPLVIQPVTLADPALVEIAGFAGIEAVMLDCEHGMIGTETVRSMMAHAYAAGIAPVYRPRSFEPVTCRQALDQGAAGIHIQHIDTAEEAREVVAACRYAPLGCREMSLGRGLGYDISNMRQYVSQANDCLLVTVMIESVTSLENVHEIAAVEGVDVLHMGTADLTHSMGLTFGEDNPEIGEAIDRVLVAGKAHGVAVGIPTEDPAEVATWAAKGVRYFEADTPDYVLRSHWASREAELKKAFASS
jgi:4-hydroxy-2-oxoheptanedioate aldolase